MDSGITKSRYDILFCYIFIVTHLSLYYLSVMYIVPPDSFVEAQIIISVGIFSAGIYREYACKPPYSIFNVYLWIVYSCCQRFALSERV